MASEQTAPEPPTLSPEEQEQFDALYQLCKASYPELDDWVVRGLCLMFLRGELPEEVPDNQTVLAKRFKIDEAVAESQPETPQE